MHVTSTVRRWECLVTINRHVDNTVEEEEEFIFHKQKYR